ncbi:MAG: PadR family transcriptional regulator [Candidatus Thorarchaeota archaeon]|nr:PadR family transcriptional regulator [Candidatus Thorarchaeota archaeon]
MHEADSLLPTTYLTVLTLIARGAKYGYEINDVIERHGYRNWVDLQFSSIYKALNELETRGLIKGVKEDESLRGSKKVYSLTAKGKRVLKNQILETLSNPPRSYTVFDLGLSAMSYLTKKEALESLRAYHTKLEQNIDFLATQVQLLKDLDNVKRKRPNQIIGNQQAQEIDENEEIEVVVALFERPLRSLECQLAWLGEFIQKTETGKGFRFRDS